MKIHVVVSGAMRGVDPAGITAAVLLPLTFTGTQKHNAASGVNGSCSPTIAAATLYPGWVLAGAIRTRHIVAVPTGPFNLIEPGSRELHAEPGDWFLSDSYNPDGGSNGC